MQIQALFLALLSLTWVSAARLPQLRDRDDLGTQVCNLDCPVDANFSDGAYTLNAEGDTRGEDLEQTGKKLCLVSSLSTSESEALSLTARHPFHL